MKLLPNGRHRFASISNDTVCASNKFMHFIISRFKLIIAWSDVSTSVVAREFVTSSMTRR